MKKNKKKHLFSQQNSVLICEPRGSTKYQRTAIALSEGGLFTICYTLYAIPGHACPVPIVRSQQI